MKGLRNIVIYICLFVVLMLQLIILSSIRREKGPVGAALGKRTYLGTDINYPIKDLPDMEREEAAETEVIAKIEKGEFPQPAEIKEGARDIEIEREQVIEASVKEQEAIMAEMEKEAEEEFARMMGEIEKGPEGIEKEELTEIEGGAS